MKPKAPKKRDPKPSAKSGEVVEVMSFEERLQKQFDVIRKASQSILDFYGIVVSLKKIKD